MRMYITILGIALVTVFSKAAYGQETSRRDQLRTAVQGICPISGERLGQHGPPVKVQVGKETVFLCCQGCLKGQISPQHWATIHANIARAQTACPVMKKNLPANPKWMITEGQVVYICCPPCTDKIDAQPEMYLRQIDELYATFLKTGQPRR